MNDTTQTQTNMDEARAIAERAATVFLNMIPAYQSAEAALLKALYSDADGLKADFGDPDSIRLARTCRYDIAERVIAAAKTSKLKLSPVWDSLDGHLYESPARAARMSAPVDQPSTLVTEKRGELIPERKEEDAL